MSLILEALKKLERERETPGRGFLVVAHSPWASARGGLARLALVAAGVGALAGGTAWIVWTALSSRGRPAPVASGPGPAGAASAAASASATASTLPPPIWRQASPAPTAAAPTRAAAAPAASPAMAVAPGPEPATLVIAPRAAPENARSPALRLEAISQQDGEPVAVINGQLVRKGESIEGALVTWIGADAVEVEIAGRRQVLSF